MNKVRHALDINKIEKMGCLGENIVTAVLDTGICRHSDFEDRIIGFKDFVNGRTGCYDDEGHGSHVAGIIAGNGSMSGYKYRGVAPKSQIVSLKVLDKNGLGIGENVVNAARWIIDNGKKYKIRIVNISFGTLNSDDNNKKIVESIELLWDLGYIIVAAAGNNGPGRGTVSIPGSSKKVITVGAANDNVKMKINGKIKKNYSGRGPTKECIIKPDVVAPANNIISCSNLWKNNYYYVSKSGTSMATPIVTGAIAAMLSIKTDLTNNGCKRIIRDTSIDLNMDKNRQGWGLINPTGMINSINLLSF